MAPRQAHRVSLLNLGANQEHLCPAMLLVCEACPVSVSVRPERLSVSGLSTLRASANCYSTKALKTASAESL